MLKTPVLLIIFNRPEITQLVFDTIKQQKPNQLFIAADGPRPERPDDIEKCKGTRKIIEQVDWDCDLKLLFHDQNIGCGYGPAKAISWFFDNVEEGIILEDDCLPALDFFTFCEDLLKIYRDDEDIYMLNGFNNLGHWKEKRSPYFKTYISASWGWATWKRAWSKFQYNIDGWKIEENKKSILASINNQKYFNHFGKDFDFIVNNNPSDIWDVQWLYTRFLNKGMTITPAVNLISNIGFGQDATHTFSQNDKQGNSQTFRLKKPLKKVNIKKDRLYEWLVFERFFNLERKSKVMKLMLKLVRLYFRTN